MTHLHPNSGICICSVYTCHKFGEFNSSSLRIYFELTSTSLRFHFGFTSISHRFHFELTSISFPFHFDFNSTSLRFVFGFTSISLRIHFDCPSISLRFHMGERGNALPHKGKRKTQRNKRKRKSPVRFELEFHLATRPRARTNETKRFPGRSHPICIHI